LVASVDAARPRSVMGGSRARLADDARLGNMRERTYEPENGSSAVPPELKLKGILLFHCPEPGQPMSPGGEWADLVLIGRPYPLWIGDFLPISCSAFTPFA